MSNLPRVAGTQDIVGPTRSGSKPTLNSMLTSDPMLSPKEIRPHWTRTEKPLAGHEKMVQDEVAAVYKKATLPHGM
ncbi:MAG: hypothetical protein GDA39_02545 [Hyphomonadaceae bacterium]|nr:hypothetical protein [Hyphomonadaceae bacterium]MBC6411847.1 hypothetical protein [Hyphomonadaceae bacterium]